ncbi:1,4-alpha-glucan-branching enzyme 2 [Heracleum sosnowskyi]|uniref:1,4-alpha-glucan-branching enzyme 2 n=1 Tax=Heracleum sosnowskyi TaxID=360622 RepID=A0AAD8JK61_9APIA|nr:1,4-alpha-glucan-branching enzyme 2 [Heracleum sosnowskyi]
MAHHHDKKKHLRELLSEDQEPFLLDKHIADKRCYLKTTTSLQPKKHNLFINQTSSSSKHVSFLCRKACFMSFKDSPEFKKSPFPSPAKSPCKAAATRFLHIPAKTAAMLLEAALKIQSTKPKTQAQNSGFGLFGSFFKRLGNKNKARKREICVNDASTASVEETIVVLCSKKMEEISEDTRRVSSAGWSESNEGKSLDMESCSTTSRSDCSSPTSSPFHFALQTNLTPDILSPVASPVCHSKKDDEHDKESLQKIPVAEEAEQDQFSPVSVLDPPFEDDDEQHRGDEEDEEDSDFDVEGSYAIVQRAKLQLLHKLRRFERLAELDPVELEKRMLEDQEEDDDDNDEEECDYVKELKSSLHMQENLDEVVREVLNRSNQFDENKIPSDVRRLLLDLIAEERKSELSGEAMVSGVCKRLNAWKEVESNTIDMMVELDFRKEVDGWTQYEEEVRDRARDIELAIFELLVEELVC